MSAPLQPPKVLNLLKSQDVRCNAAHLAKHVGFTSCMAVTHPAGTHSTLRACTNLVCTKPSFAALHASIILGISCRLPWLRPPPHVYSSNSLPPFCSPCSPFLHTSTLCVWLASQARQGKRSTPRHNYRFLGTPLFDGNEQ